MSTPTRRRLAKRIEEAFLSQHDMEVTCNPEKIYFVTGFHRTSPEADAYRWTAPCIQKGLAIGPVVDSYDTATSCIKKGIRIRQTGHFADWEASVIE